MQLPSPGALESDADRRRIQEEEADRRAQERVIAAAQEERDQVAQGKASYADEWERTMSDKRNFRTPPSVGVGDAKVFGSTVSVRTYDVPNRSVVLWVCSNGALNTQAFLQPT